MNLTKVLNQTFASVAISIVLYLYISIVFVNNIYGLNSVHGGVQLGIIGALTLVVYIFIEWLLKKFTAKQLKSFAVKFVLSYLIARGFVYILLLGNLSGQMLTIVHLLLTWLLVPVFYFLMTIVSKPSMIMGSSTPKKNKLARSVVFGLSLIMTLVAGGVILLFIYELFTGGYDASGLGLLFMIVLVIPTAIAITIAGLIGMKNSRK